MGLRHKLLGFVRSAMNIKRNPFESQFWTGLAPNATKATPKSGIVQTFKKFSPFLQPKNSSPIWQRQRSSMESSKTNNGGTDGVGMIFGTWLCLMGLFHSLVTPVEKSKTNRSDDLVALLMQASAAQSQNDYIRAYKIYASAFQYVERKKSMNEYDATEYLQSITFIHDNLADLAFKRGDYVTAENSYRSTMQGNIQLGMAQTDNMIIQIMIKLATIYALLKKEEEAHACFQFCINTEEEKVKVNANDKETLGLLRLTTESYGRYLLHSRDFEGADIYLKRALEVCRQTLGKDHPHMYVLINEYVNVKIITHEFKEAEIILTSTIKESNGREIKEMADIYHSIGRIHFKRGQSKKALQAYQKSLAIAKDTACGIRVTRAQKSIDEIQAKA